MNNQTKRIIGAILLAILIAASFLNLFYKDALEFQNSASKEVLASVAILSEIEGLTIPLAESIPLLKDWAHTYEDDFNKLLNYLDISSMMILLQLTLLEISQWMLFKWAMVVLFIGLFIPALRSTSFKLLVLALMISPGLSIYTSAMQGVVKTVDMNLGGELNQSLEATRDSINARKQMHQSRLDSLESYQESEHHDHLTLGDRIEDGVLKTTYNVEDDLDKIGKEILDILRFAAQNGVRLAIAALVNILIVFGLMPLLFWYVFSLFLKKLFGYGRPLQIVQQEEQQLKNITTSNKS
ncbi:MAG TPA: hypothetical protein DCG19_08980 [Cryomorphaceae bacterium]|nr:hypothetical protein [Owenweeksia sp.]HAD97527.1 hypothetical protein [Cryomorphaceae bacterium]HCQ14697.1 hypothetical protein [Cryomorphaceae bacterium]|tara:strand:+ start:242 stop:1132 length:891 start_codon:yes stop_codon:yes gene_type:complete